MRTYFGDWRVNMTVLLIILFFTAPLFLVAYQLGVYVRDNHYLPRITEQALKKERDLAERKRAVGQQWGSANCGENFEQALHENQRPALTLNNGVVYIARTGFIDTSRAITLWGATGRLRGWRAYKNAGKYYWRQQ